jgi:signal transduction histidine kinase
VHVIAHAHGDALLVEVRDDGCGFDPRSATAGFGLGLAGMRERVALAGGELEVDSNEGGTRLTARIPARRRQQTDPPEGREPGGRAPDLDSEQAAS